MKLVPSRHHLGRARGVSLLAFVTVVAVLASAGAAFGNGYVPGFYLGRTAQGKAISFLAPAAT